MTSVKVANAGKGIRFGDPLDPMKGMQVYIVTVKSYDIFCLNP